MHFGLFLLLITGVLHAETVQFINRCTGNIDEMTLDQKEVLLRSYHFGKPHGLGYTLAAIAWQESCAGEYKINFDDPSAGVFHTYIPGVFHRHPELKKNGFMENTIGQKLIDDFRFAAAETLRELQYWQRQNKTWKATVKSYNKGSKWKRDSTTNTKAEKYYTRLASKISALKPFIKNCETYGLLNTDAKSVSLPIYSRRQLDQIENFALLNE